MPSLLAARSRASFATSPRTLLGLTMRPELARPEAVLPPGEDA